jgi:hypothetical protein
MNPRIEKLFEQALEEFKAENKYATIIIPNPLKEKFAELIVKECAGICDELQTVPATEPRHCAEDIRIFFGITE